jgi:hypothetical protein
MLLQKALPGIISTVSLIIAITGCEGPRGPAGSSNPIVYITGEIAGAYAGAEIGAEIVVVECSSIPSVSINGTPCERSLFWYTEGFRFGQTVVGVSPGDSVYVEVNYVGIYGEDKTAWSDVVVPGIFEITSHDPAIGQIIPVGSDFVVEWTASEGTDAYQVYFECHYSYHDTLWQSQSYYMELDTFVVDTSITFNAERLFPDFGSIANVYGSYGHFHVEAVSGPCLEGDLGNVHGDALGIIQGRFFAGGFYVDVE